MSSPSSSDPLSLLSAGQPSEGDDDPIREQILDAATAQFASVGIARSTMGDITRRAGLARMTLYRRFANKQDLVEAALMREAWWFLSALQQEIDSHDSLEGKLTEGFAFTITRLRDHGLLNRLLETEAESTVPYFTVQGAPLITAAAHFLADVVSRSVPDNRSREELLVVSEVVVRLVVSFILSPSMIIDLDDPGLTRAFARNQIGPLLGPSEFPPGA
ncbi:TetR/AcrR family transcriptional regulator [Dietzia aerolata]|uniref:TetR/AcrR family transcriptional regulator n=1 Tax=Dietzia aerolata TaxID=595984 RepID=A0ABV5JSB1_9ACTN|nr:TetR/AcrR family transcriptional regulator [Dietzia aerolata]MBB0967808.1 TetR/AcrR family transcriptional regulator [Dietzia aerolata]